MWLRSVHTKSGIYMNINVKKYIESQPVEYAQVEKTIDYVRQKKVPVFAYIDVSELDVSKVDIIGLANLVFDLHEHTKDDKFLQYIKISHAANRTIRVWNVIKYLLPKFVVDVVQFKI